MRAAAAFPSSSFPSTFIVAKHKQHSQQRSAAHNMNTTAPHLQPVHHTVCGPQNELWVRAEHNQQPLQGHTQYGLQAEKGVAVLRGDVVTKSNLTKPSPSINPPHENQHSKHSFAYLQPH